MPIVSRRYNGHYDILNLHYLRLEGRSSSSICLAAS